MFHSGGNFRSEVEGHIYFEEEKTVIEGVREQMISARGEEILKKKGCLAAFMLQRVRGDPLVDGKEGYSRISYVSAGHKVRWCFSIPLMFGMVMCLF